VNTAKVHLTLSIKMPGERDLAALGFASPAREEKILTPRKGRSAHYFEEIFH